MTGREGGGETWTGSGETRGFEGRGAKRGVLRDEEQGDMAIEGRGAGRWGPLRARERRERDRQGC